MGEAGAYRGPRGSGSPATCMIQLCLARRAHSCFAVVGRGLGSVLGHELASVLGRGLGSVLGGVLQGNRSKFPSHIWILPEREPEQTSLGVWSLLPGDGAAVGSARPSGAQRAGGIGACSHCMAPAGALRPL